ncbi:MAG: hypothetical protein PHG82_05215 [Candidatus Gracilibacteria bacterium]|nr:hypothetical protein [Candidatus Gracilibacteria bacterium]
MADKIHILRRDLNIFHNSISSVAFFRQTFSSLVDTVLETQRKLKYNDPLFSGTTNGEIIINPIFSSNGNIKSYQEGYFHTYHAYLKLINSGQLSEKIKYNPLSAGVLLYSRKTGKFYGYKRPDDSQEDSGKIDVIGGYFNPKVSKDNNGLPDPKEHVISRLKSKIGLIPKDGSLNFIGFQEFSDRHFYNLLYIYFLDENELEKIDKNKLNELNDINNSEVSNNAIELIMKSGII